MNLGFMVHDEVLRSEIVGAEFRDGKLWLTAEVSGPYPADPGGDVQFVLLGTDLREVCRGRTKMKRVEAGGEEDFLTITQSLSQLKIVGRHGVFAAEVPA